MRTFDIEHLKGLLEGIYPSEQIEAMSDRQILKTFGYSIADDLMPEMSPDLSGQYWTENIDTGDLSRSEINRLMRRIIFENRKRKRARGGKLPSAQYADDLRDEKEDKTERDLIRRGLSLTEPICSLEEAAKFLGSSPGQLRKLLDTHEQLGGIERQGHRGEIFTAAFIPLVAYCKRELNLLGKPRYPYPKRKPAMKKSLSLNPSRQEIIDFAGIIIKKEEE